MSTFQYQNTLKKLPIPDLKQTCENYLKVLKPLQTELEFSNTEKAVNQFLNEINDGDSKSIGYYLDEKLRNYANDKASYIEQFWYDAYLNYDSPVVLNLNPFFLLEDDPFTSTEASSVDPQIKRATTLTLSSLKFIQALKNETLSIDTLKNGKPLCMYQFTKLFGASRIPTDDGCMMQSDSKSNHIVVMSKSQFYWFDVLDSKNNILLNESELNINFNSIVYDSLKTSNNDIAKSSFGVLTTENRRIWANARKEINDNKINKEVLSIIDSALFILCLDDIVIDDLSQLSKNMLCGLSILDKGIQVGTCTNRWYDKLQIIITKNGKAGINFEHTGIDGHTVLRFVSDIYTDSILSFAQSINRNAPSLWKETRSPSIDDEIEEFITVPRKLEWDLTPDLSLALRFGETRLSDLINQNEFRHLEFKSYGSDLIKKMKFSPDAFVQMAFQATYYALYGKVECTYEPAMTKHFFHGRTEAIRTVSNESNLFVRKFFDSQISNKDKLEYLNQACKAHSAQTRLCSNGEGVDRHLYAIFCLWKRLLIDENDNNDIPKSIQQIPSIFQDSGWDKLNNTIISTSNCGNPALRLFGFGPTTANGFGIGYIIKDDSISFCVGSKYRQTQRFLVTLNSYFQEIQKIWQNVETSKKLNIDELPKINNKNLTSLLGGYGYFDMGDEDIKSRGQTPEPPFLSRGNSSYTLRDIGKKLRLSEY
ncbi:YAT1 [Candida pseudojiufengensis]|uniref:YAT1 n=1 Tax=Candida pseudojiufengensis TaxID=497109 RepID=UPI002224BD2B|nr:YAT1 [Candida pseudojiufengensis]KAI5961267.1 YAT1 [Candida pseudojiufengensis]